MGKWDFYTTNEFKPCGWLKRQLELEASGLCGNLDKVWRDVKDSSWIGGDAEGWERVPYWLDGFIPLAYLLEDDDMIARAKKYINAIISNQKPDGWICPCEDNERKSYDLWAVLLITKVLTVYYECSSDERIPKVIYDTLKNLYELLESEKIKLFGWGEYRWFEGFIAIDFTYQIYKEDWLLKLARILREQGKDYTKLINQWQWPLNRWTMDTHIVNIVMALKSEAVSCDLLGESYTDIAEKLYSTLNEYNGTPVGTFTGDECLSGLSPIQGTELCSVVEQMYSYEQLYAKTGDDKWAARLEVLAFNALPATISDDMWTHQYLQMSNQIACEKFPGKPIFRTDGGESHLFGLEPNFGCCTANFGQGWPKLALSAFMHNGDTVINVIPVPCELKTDDKHINIITDYPFKNSFAYDIRSKCDFTFKIRIPEFAQNLVVDGKPIKAKELSFDIFAGESSTINVSYDVTPHFVQRPNELTCVKCGSLVFSVPIDYEKSMHEYEKDGVLRKYPYCDYELSPKSDWNYAYCGGNLTVEQGDISDIPFSSKNPPITVKAAVTNIDWGYEDGYDTVCAKMPSSTVPLCEQKQISLYPYGCAKLRMTEIPQIKR